MYNETGNYSLEAVLTRIEGKIDGYQKYISRIFDKIEKRLTILEELKVDFKTLDFIETLRQDELTSRPQTLAELEERIEGLESDQIDQDNRIWLLLRNYEFITDEMQKLWITIKLLDCVVKEEIKNLRIRE